MNTTPAASLPTYNGIAYTPSDMRDPDWERDVLNHWMMFGSEALCTAALGGRDKQGRNRRWVVEFRGRGPSIVFKSKKKAAERASSWIIDIARRVRGVAS